jgi:phospholipid transport system substrate-binding protein
MIMLKNMLMLLTLSTVLAVPAYGSAETSPEQTVHESVDAIIALLKDDTLDQDDRRARIRAHINTRFDFNAMSQRTLATNWKKATAQEREKFITLFSQLIENTYIGKIEAYTNEKVEYPGEKVKGSKALVETLIIAASADIPVDYKLYKKGDDWLVYDVIIEGVSLVSNYRSSYQEIVKKEGFDGLLVKMQEKIDELNTPTPEEPADTAAAT